MSKLGGKGGTTPFRPQTGPQKTRRTQGLNVRSEHHRSAVGEELRTDDVILLECLRGSLPRLRCALLVDKRLSASEGVISCLAGNLAC